MLPARLAPLVTPFLIPAAGKPPEAWF